MTEPTTIDPIPIILVVDDTPENLRLLGQILSNAGYKVRLVPGGKEALAAISSTPPDLILLDIMMPEVSGFQVAEALKVDPKSSPIPIIFISALDDLESKLQAFKLGGVDYVTKPFQEHEVLARIKTHLALCRLQHELQTANTALAQQVEELHARNQELDAFAHTVAHDLKNPLGGIYLSTSIVVDNYADMPTEEQLEMLRTNLRVTELMNRSIEGLMVLAGLREQAFEPEVFQMGPVVAEALGCLVHTIQDAKAEIVNPSDWPAAMGYISWVEEVWVNYLSNAIKYGGQPQKGIYPRIELGFDLPSSGVPGSQIRFWVWDNGPGLTPEQQASLFTPFERLKNVRVKGHGLGLSIVRRIMDKLGGQAGVESSPGKGSIFYFTLPGVPNDTH